MGSKTKSLGTRDLSIMRISFLWEVWCAGGSLAVVRLARALPGIMVSGMMEGPRMAGQLTLALG